MRLIIFKILRYFNDKEPSRYEAMYCINVLCTKRRHMLHSKLLYVLDCYADGDTYKQISKDLEISEHRVIKIIRRGCKEVNGF
jgi:DNA-binding NarL/FixJ family response regulator